MSDKPKPYKLYFWPTPNGKKISIYMEEARLPYVIKPVNISAGDQLKPAFLKISPNNKMPVLTDPQGPGGEPLHIFESGAILQYLGRKTGAYYPITERGRAEVDQWLFFQMASIGPMSGQCYHFRGLPKQKSIPYGVKRYTKEVTRLYGVMDKQLKTRDYIAGAYSIADMALYPWILPKPLGQNMEDFPNLQSWRERMAARAGVKAGMEAGKDLRK
jgi:glutathione S-transferase